MSQDRSNETVRFRCPGCEKLFGVPARHAGRKTRCPDCDRELVVPKPPEPRRERSLVDEYVTVSCGLCKTRMSVPVAYVGRKVKCPDCHTLTVVKPPAPKATPQVPPAMSGEQYELDEGEGQPTGESQPELIAVECAVCGTRLHAARDQIGRKIECPDCGAKTPVHEPKPLVASRWVEGDGEDLEVEAPVETTQASYYERGDESAPLGYRTDEAGKPIVGHGMEDAPRDAMVRGVLKFWASGGAVGAYFVLACATLVWQLALLFGGQLLLASIGSMAMVAALFVIVAAIVLAVGWFAILSMTCVTVLTASADGAEKVPYWPWIDPSAWFAAAARLFFAVMIALAPGGFAATNYAPDALTGMSWMLLSLWALLPWMLLSQLETDTTLLVFSPRLLMSLAWAPLSWMMYYLWTALLVGGAWWVDLETFERLGMRQVILTAPLYALVFLTCARLLGRLAWVIGSRGPEVEE